VTVYIHTALGIQVKKIVEKLATFNEDIFRRGGGGPTVPLAVCFIVAVYLHLGTYSECPCI
jgi:hypothetical protein